MAKTDLSGCSKSHTHRWISLRQPLRCGLTILVCSCVMLGAAQCQARGHQEQQEQSVAEAARQARARREQAKKAHVYTDEDLKRAKILTPEDEERVAARKQAPPAMDESSQPALDARLAPELPLGDIARRYRNAKQLLQDTAPFHLPFDEPVFAAPVAELPKVEAPLPSFTPSRPKIVVAQPKKVTAPNVTSTVPSAAVRRVDPFAPRLAPVAPRPELHGATVTPHMPSASAPVVPSAPRVEGAAPGNVAAGLTLPTLEPSAPKRSVHVAPAVPHLPSGDVTGSVAVLHVQSAVPGAPLTLPSVEPAAPKVRPHIAEVNPRIPANLQHAAPMAPRMESTPSNAGAQLVLPGIEPVKPSLHVAPVTPHVPAGLSGRIPVAPRLDGGFSGMNGIMPRVESNVVAPESPIVAAVPVVNVSGNSHSVVVGRGDSLWKIALKSLGRGSRWPELMAENPAIVDPTRLEVGATVIVPNETVRVRAERKSVVVWRGDSLTQIAQANYGRASAWRCIAEANPQIRDPNRIFEGQTLTLPESCHK